MAGAQAYDTSIVIPVRNDPLLPRAIESTPAEAEVIVAMTAPPPGAADAVRRAMPGRNLRIVISEVPGMSAGVNLGARSAGNEKVVILDSDCRLLPGALEAYSKALDVCAFVRGVTMVERSGFWSRIAALGTESLNKVFEREARLFGPSIAFRKTDFLALGGYDESMLHGSCDQEFALRVERRGIAVRYEPGAVVLHRPLTFRIDARSHLGYGRGQRQIDGKLGGRSGLRYCLVRLDPRELLRKAAERGGMSVVRSLLLGVLMLLGYLEESASVRLGGKARAASPSR
jgi:glycosyltransferase involved in cell wall biosynthesis